MAIFHMDNWSLYGRNLAFMTNGLWAEINNSGTGVGDTLKFYDDPDGVTAGTVLAVRCFFANLGEARYIMAGPQTKIGQACRIWLSSIPSSGGAQANKLFCFKDFSNNVIVYAEWNTIGGIDVYKGGIGSGTLIGRSTGPVVTANAWWHMEVVADLAAQTIEIRKEGASVVWGGGGFGSGTVLATGALSTTSCQQLSIIGTGGNNAVPVMYVKDLVWYDGSGSQNNTFLGSVSVYTLAATTDVSVPWTKTGSTTASGVLNQSPPQDGAVYLAADYPSIPGPVSVNLSHLPTNVTTVRGIQAIIRGKKVDGGDGNLQQGLISGATTGQGVNRAISAAATYFKDIFETDPNTSSPWSVAATNLIQYTFNRTL